MKRLKTRYNNLSIFRKIIIWMLAVSIIPLGVMVMFNVSKILSMEISHTQSDIVNGLQWIENDVMQEIDELRLQAIKVSMNNKVQTELAQKENSGDRDVYEMKKSLYNISLSGQCHSAYITDFQGLQLSNHTSPVLNEMIAERVPGFREQLEGSIMTYVWGEPFTFGTTWLLPYTRFIEDEKAIVPVGLFVANYPESSLSRITWDTMKNKETQVENVLILNDGVIISSWDKELIGKALTDLVPEAVAEETFDGEYNGGNCKFLSYIDENSSDWCYMAIVSYKEIHASSRSIILLFICISIACAAIIVFASFLVSRSISKPLEYLSGAMQEIGDSKDLNVELKYPAYEDEVGKMWRCLIDMTGRLKTSIAENQHALEQNQRLRIETLKAQINPHFLYNTFGSIIYLIEEGKKKEATEMLAALSELLHISISRSMDFIQVEQELGLIRRYMDIQKIRYQDRFRYLIDVDMDIMKLRIVKIVLQPVVENALEYGVKKNSDAQALIVIRGWREDDLLIFEVMDDCGMLTERRMTEVNERLRSVEPAPEAKVGIGLKNVNDRICYEFPGDERQGVCLMRCGNKTVTRITLKVMEEQRDGTI